MKKKSKKTKGEDKYTHNYNWRFLKAFLFIDEITRLSAVM
jgi:hypothetical protein